MFPLIDTFYKCRDLAGKFSFPCLTVKKKIPFKVSLLCSLHRVKAPDDLNQRLGQRYCLKASSEFHQHSAFRLFLSMTCTSWPRRAESARGTEPQMNSSGTSGLLLPGCIVQGEHPVYCRWMSSRRMVGNAYYDLIGHALNMGLFKQIRGSSKINKQITETKQSPDNQPAFLCLFACTADFSSFVQPFLLDVCWISNMFLNLTRI